MRRRNDVFDGGSKTGVDFASDAAFDNRFLDDDDYALSLGVGGDENSRENDNNNNNNRRQHQPRLVSEMGFLSRPNPPTALTIYPLLLRNGLNISWSSSLDAPSAYSNASAVSAVPASFFIVEYRSKDSFGWEENKPLLWSALTDRLVDKRWTTIQDIRPGFRYEFRVFAFSALNSFRFVLSMVLFVMC